jgi:hypothetical protein
MAIQDAVKRVFELRLIISNAKQELPEVEKYLKAELINDMPEALTINYDMLRRRGYSDEAPEVIRHIKR